MQLSSLSPFKYIKWFLIIIVIAGAGVLLLTFAGKLFIQEVTQEVVLEEEGGKVFGIDIGEAAPHFELSDLEGNAITLSDFLGKPLVLTFWATWNAVAADQVKILDQYLSVNSESLFRIVTINNQEDKSIVSNFMRRGGYNVSVLLDETGEIGELYEARTLPVTYFLDKDGVVRDILVGILSEEMLAEKAERIVK